MRVALLLVGAAFWASVMVVTFYEGHPGWTVVEGILGAFAFLSELDE